MGSDGILRPSEFLGRKVQHDQRGTYTGVIPVTSPIRDQALVGM